MVPRPFMPAMLPCRCARGAGGGARCRRPARAVPAACAGVCLRLALPQAGCPQSRRSAAQAVCTWRCGCFAACTAAPLHCCRCFFKASLPWWPALISGCGGVGERSSALALNGFIGLRPKPGIALRCQQRRRRPQLCRASAAQPAAAPPGNRSRSSTRRRRQRQRRGSGGTISAPSCTVVSRRG